MNQYVDVFLRQALEQVRYKKMHPYLAQELNDHIELLKEEIMEEGVSEELAYKEAVEQMGEPIDIGKRLHELHQPKMEWGIFVLILGLIMVGILALVNYNAQFSEAMYLEKQIRFIGLGMVSFCVLYFIDYRKLEKISGMTYIIAVAIVVITLIAGIQINGARRWLSIGGFTIKATNVAMPLFMISYVGLIRKWSNRGRVGCAMLGILAIGTTFLCMLSQVSDGVYLVITFLGIFIVYILSSAFKGDRKKASLLLIGWMTTIIGGMVYFVISAEWRIQRLVAWLNPEKDPMGKGYFVNTIRKMIGGAGWLGNEEGIRTAGGSIRLPDSATDFIFTFIVGSMGWLTGLLIVMIIGAAIIRCFEITKRTRDEYGRMLLYTISIFLLVQYTLGIVMNLGLLPISAVSLPFMSYGGSKIICDMGMMGFFLGIYRRVDITPCELVQTKEASEHKTSIKTGRKSRMILELVMNILNTSDEIEEISIKFKEKKGHKLS